MTQSRSHQPKKATPEDVLSYLQRTKEKTDQLIDTDFSASFQISLLKLPMLSANEKLVYIVLKSYASQDGSAFPSAKRIGMDASLSVRAVQRAIEGLSDPDRLLGMPLVTIKRRFDGNRPIANEYTLHSPKPILQKIMGQASELPKKTQSDGIKKESSTCHTDRGYLSHRQGVPVTQTGGTCHTDRGYLSESQDVVKDQLVKDQLVKDQLDNNNKEREKDVVVVPPLLKNLFSKIEKLTGQELTPGQGVTLEALSARYGVERVEEVADILPHIKNLNSVFGALIAGLEQEWEKPVSSVSENEDEQTADRYQSFYNLFEERI